MMSKIFSPLDLIDPEKMFWDIVKVIAVCAIFSGMILILAATWALFHPPQTKPSFLLYQYNYQPDKKFKKLQRKHGLLQVIIYEPGQTPYYKCGKGGKAKCRLI